MSKLDISNVVRVTLLSALRGLADINTSALAIITDEAPIAAGFGVSGVYKSATAVAEDFGSTSDTARLAEMVFAQNPNILSGGGYLVVIPREAAADAQPATILASGPVNLLVLTGTDYEISAAVDGGADADYTIGAINLTSLATAEASLNSTEVAAAGLVFSLSGELSSAILTLKSATDGATSAITIGTAATGTDIAGALNIAGAAATGAAAGAERVKDAILRTAGSIDYFGIIVNEIMADAVLLETARLVQTMDKLLFVGSDTAADYQAAGVFETIKNAGLTHTRCLFYSTSEATALDFAAGYAGRGLSVNFSGVNTAHTMHLKEVVGFPADSAMNQTAVTEAGRAGVDVYADFGVPKVFTSGANQYFDQIYSRLAFKVRLQIAGFNYLSQTNTKIPQTESGLAGLKNAYRRVCQAFVTNGVFAPGEWTGSTTFGDPETHRTNIRGFGFYIYSDPIAGQSVADRAARIAPSIYIAGKDSGAIHSSDVTVFVED